MKTIRKSILIVVVIGLFVCCNNKFSIIDNNCNSNYYKQAEIDGKFLKKVLSGYNSFIKEKRINEIFKDSFKLFNNKGISAEIIYSEHSGKFIYFKNDQLNRLEYKCTELPSQMYFFLGIEKLEKKYFINKTKLMDDFEWRKGSVIAQKQNSNIRTTFLSQITIRDNFGKAFKCSDKGIFIMSDITYMSKVPIKFYNNKIVKNTVKLNNVGFYTENSNFGDFISVADSIGIKIAEYEFVEFFLNSKFFRKTLKHNELQKIAKKINEKYSKSKKVQDYEYPLWELELDKSKLIEAAKKFNIEPEYAERLLKDSRNIPTDGVLLFHYKNYMSFAIQWIIINILLLILSLIFGKKWNALKGSILTKWGSPTIVTSINFWIFSSKMPEYMEMSYWLIPSVVAVLTVLILTKQNIKNND